MMYGTVDSVDDRIEHLRVLRNLQDETGGFRAFVCWSYQSGGCSARDDLGQQRLPAHHPQVSLVVER